MIKIILQFLLSNFLFLTLISFSQASGKSSRIIENNDADGDKKISRDEWPRSGRRFRRIDLDDDDYLTLKELQEHFDETEEEDETSTTFILEGQVAKEELDKETICSMRHNGKCAIDAIVHGLFETGLTPQFPAKSECRGIDDHYAMDYSHKRHRESYHAGIDIPAPYGTPIHAVANGAVIAKYPMDNSPRGIEIILRHSPEDTGLPYWIYTQYTHFNEMPKQTIGQRIQMGEVLGPTGNSGLHPKKGGQHQARRPAIHFAVFYSDSEQFAEYTRRNTVWTIPIAFNWMDPMALYRGKTPLDSDTISALADKEKRIPISIMYADGKIFPSGSKLIWPYTCERE